MTVALDSVRTELAALLGVAGVLTDRAACAAFAVDGIVPDFIATPSTAEHVASILAFANEHQLALIPCGSGTKLSTGNPPKRYDAALSLRKLNRLIHYEPADLTITVEAGMTFGEFQELVGRDGLWLPLDVRGGAQSSIGGIIAANAAGPLRQSFGGPRDMVLGLKIATTDGKIAKTGGRVVKNVAGYDLGKLLTGSFGTLGVIVEASLKLFTKPPARATYLIRAGTLEVARDLRGRIRCSPLDPLRLVVACSDAGVRLRDSAPDGGMSETDLWIEVSGSDRVTRRCEQELTNLSAAAGADLERVGKAEEVWDRIADPARWLQSKYPELSILKAALPPRASEEFLSRARQQAESEQIGFAGFAQAGVGIVHACLLQQTLTPGTAGVVARLRHAAEDLGGTLIIEHCPVALKSQIDAWGARGDDLDAMRKLKSAWDPLEILSPGRFVGGI